ncbi:MAG TPA: hypothetical protein VKF63_05485 [Terracidiphilus sp.]|nr:hypothetical protein [Terracidiphilus sp.]
MRKFAALLFAFIFSSLTPQALADVAAIHADKLPQETAILDALDDAKQLEPYSRSWTIKWQYPIAKEEVATRLGKDLGFLTLALKNHPENAELLLLTGLVARYAYNLDIEGSQKTALNVLEQAQKLDPSDVRAPWFRATLTCQTTEPKAGADEFLSIEASHDWEMLPIAFWDDYIDCAVLTNMPAHALRAADHLEKLHAPESTMRTFLTNGARKRFDAFDPMKKYEPKEVWEGANPGESPDFTSTMCGVRLRVHGNWEISQIGMAKGGCIANFSTGPYKAKTQKMFPSILLIIRQPDGKETLAEFSKKCMNNIKDSTFLPYTPVLCPDSACIAMSGILPGAYEKNGDGHIRLVMFERDQPEFPGLIFEGPMELPKSNGGEQVQYYSPNQIQQRMPGKLYYLVLLDTAASIEEPAMKDFDFFLENLTVE